MIRNVKNYFFAIINYLNIIYIIIEIKTGTLPTDFSAPPERPICQCAQLFVWCLKVMELS